MLFGNYIEMGYIGFYGKYMFNFIRNHQVKWKSLSRVQLCDSMDYTSPRNSPGQNTGVGSRFLLQGIFPTQGLNPGLLHYRRILYHLSHKGSPDSQNIQYHFVSVQSLGHVRLFATPWITARQVSLSITISQSSLKLTSIESVMPSSHLILCHPLSSPSPPAPNPSQHQSLFIITSNKVILVILKWVSQWF